MKKLGLLSCLLFFATVVAFSQNLLSLEDFCDDELFKVGMTAQQGLTLSLGTRTTSLGLGQDAFLEKALLRFPESAALYSCYDRGYTTGLYFLFGGLSLAMAGAVGLGCFADSLEAPAFSDPGLIISLVGMSLGFSIEIAGGVMTQTSYSDLFAAIDAYNTRRIADYAKGMRR